MDLVGLKLLNMDLIYTENQLKEILKLKEIRRSGISRDSKVSYHKLTTFTNGGSVKWDYIDNHLPLCSAVGLLLDRVNKVGTITESSYRHILDLAWLEERLFFSSLLKKTTTKAKAARIAAKVKTGTPLSVEEHNLLYVSLNMLIYDVWRLTA